MTNWYNGISPLSVWNWNVILDRFDHRDRNDVSKYTMDSYIKACKSLLSHLKPTDRVYIPLPWDQVYNGEYGHPESLLLWWRHIVFELDKFEQVAGYYLADEPEHWNTQWGDRVFCYTGPRMLALKYREMKRLTSKPILVVHCDLSLYNFPEKYCDEVGVDIYPFKQSGDIELWQFKDMLKAWKRKLHNIPIRMFVFQGAGKSAGYGQRDFTFMEAAPYIEAVRDEDFAPSILFWDYPHSDAKHITTAESLHQLWVEYQKKQRNFLSRIGRLIKWILRR